MHITQAYRDVCAASSSRLLRTSNTRMTRTCWENAVLPLIVNRTLRHDSYRCHEWNG